MHTVNSNHQTGSASAADVSRTTQKFELTIVTPTLNESKNLEKFYASLTKALHGLKWELVIVDDNSKDGSAEILMEMANKYDNFRFLRRIGRSGISTAATEGMLSAASEVIAVMDVDGQHDETKLAHMFHLISKQGVDVVVGSRFADGANLVDFSSFRTNLSLWSNKMAQKWFDVQLADSMGNFFMLRRDVFENAAPQLGGRGQKLLLDILLVSPRSLKVVEVPIVFGVREHGESKLSHIAAIDFGLQLWDRSFGRFLPTKVLLDLMGILTYSLISTFVLWSIIKIGFAFTGTYFAGQWLVPLASIPSTVLAYYFQSLLIPKRKRPKGVEKIGDFAKFYAVSLPFTLVSAWVTGSVMPSGDPRLRLLFGASLTCSLGLVMAYHWRKEMVSKR
jgi:dolichol-phosphate mannosyltransferase